MPYLSKDSELTQEFLATILIQVIAFSIHSWGQRLDLIFIWKKWQQVLELGDIIFSLLPGTDHFFLALLFSETAPCLMQLHLQCFCD